MHRPSTLKNKYSNIFFYKTIATIVLKFYMEHDLAPGSQNYKIDLFHIVCAHAYIGHVARYFSIIGETLQRWGKRILSH